MKTEEFLPLAFNQDTLFLIRIFKDVIRIYSQTDELKEFKFVEVRKRDEINLYELLNDYDLKYRIDFDELDHFINKNKKENQFEDATPFTQDITNWSTSKDNYRRHFTIPVGNVKTDNADEIMNEYLFRDYDNDCGEVEMNSKYSLPDFSDDESTTEIYFKLTQEEEIKFQKWKRAIENIYGKSGYIIWELTPGKIADTIKIYNSLCKRDIFLEFNRLKNS